MTTNVDKIGAGKNRDGNPVMVAESFRGPLPPASMFKEYNDVIPGAGTDILNEFKAQGKHRRWAEKSIIVGKLYFGPLLAAAVILFGFFMGYLLIRDGKSIEGFGIIITPLVAVGGLFVWNYRMTKADDPVKKKGK